MTIRSKTALILDDEPLVRHVVRRYLQDLGFRVDGVDSAASCRERFHEACAGERPYGVVFLDVYIDGEEVVDLLDDLAARDPEIFAIAVTGDARHAVAVKPSAHGYRAALTKPFTPRQLGMLLLELDIIDELPGAPFAHSLD